MVLSIPVPPLLDAFSVSLRGSPHLAEPLGHALRAQWAYGFPIVPKPGLQLTHGFFQYPAGMQPIAAQHLLEVLPEGAVLDPFVGGGTTLVEAIRTGRKSIGADASPLALFATAHHTLMASDAKLDALRAQATEAMWYVDPGYKPPRELPLKRNPRTRKAKDAAPVEGLVDGEAADDQEAAEEEVQTTRPSASPFENLDRGGARKTTFKMWSPLRDEIERLAAQVTAEDADYAASEPSPLWFCFAAAQQRAERFRYKSPLACFDATVESYCAAVRELREASPADAMSPSLLLGDARELDLAAEGLPLADGLITSPPYAGVYDYLSHAREVRANLDPKGPAPLMGLRGTPGGRDWPVVWRSTNEMGARKAMKRRALNFHEQWEADQRAWLMAARKNVRVGGRAALLVGDGEGAIDALASTTAAAEAVGWSLLASATIESTHARADRHKGKRRPEHAILFEVVE